MKKYLCFFIIFLGSNVWADSSDVGIDALINHDYKKAIRVFKILAEKGDSKAISYLGVMYADGKGVPQNYKEAVKNYRVAAKKGFSLAQYNLGNSYLNGKGVSQDYVEALKWYRLAATQKLDYAQNGLGFMYTKGYGVVKDYTEAAKYYRLAAEQGLAIAQYNLGDSYAYGEGVLQDYNEALKWFHLAAAQGDVGAKKNIEYMHLHGLDGALSQQHNTLEYANTLEVKANSYILKDQNKEALEQFKLAIDIKKKLLGDDNEEVYGLLINIAEMYFSLKDHTKAKEILMDVAYKTKDKHSELYALALQHLAKNALTSGDYKLALTYLKEAVDILEDDNEKNADQLASVLISYGDINLSRRELNNALEAFERAQTIITKKYGSADIYNAIILIEISKTLRSLGQYESAVLKAELAIDILSKSPKATEQQMINAKNVLAINHVSLGQLSKAKDILIKAGTNSNQLDHKDIDSINTAMNLGDIYLASGEYPAASIK